MGLSKKDETQIWETMMARRRRLGPDPDDHPSIRRRMEHEFVAILLVIKWILAKLPIRQDGTCQITSSSNRHVAAYILLILLVTLGIATTILTWLTYQEAFLANNPMRIIRSQHEYLGLALAKNSNMTIKREGTDFIINYKPSLEESVSNTIRIPHGIPPEEIERLDPK